MTFDRYDICGAYYLYFALHHGGMGSWEYRRLSRMGRYFTPAPTLTLERLTANGLAIYNALCARQGAPGYEVVS